jgi:hypothetical protein
MKDILQDIVAHTHGLGFLSSLKVSTDENSTTISSITDDRSLVLQATTHERVADFMGVFGMGNLEKLNLLLKNPEYKEDAKIEIVKKTKDDIEYPAHIHFENVIGDFQNDYRFINKEVIEKNLKSVKFKGASWELEFEPPVASISRMKYMSAVHSEDPNFQVWTENNNLIFSFGDNVSHAGEFVFKHNVNATLASKKSFPIAQTQSILSLSGNSTMSISDQGVMKISVDSGFALYDYFLPSQTK